MLKMNKIFKMMEKVAAIAQTLTLRILSSSDDWKQRSLRNVMIAGASPQHSSSQRAAENMPDDRCQMIVRSKQNETSCMSFLLNRLKLIWKLVKGNTEDSLYTSLSGFDYGSHGIVIFIPV